MKKFYLNLLCLFVFTAQAQQWDWARNDFHQPSFYNQTHIAYTSGFVYATFDDSITKYSDNGTLIWTIGIPNAMINDINADKLGTFYITGTYTNTVNFGTSVITSAGEEDFFLAKYLPSGICQWVVSYGGIGRDISNSLSISLNGDVVLTGYFSDTITIGSTVLHTQPYYGCFLTACFDSNGNARWANQSIGFANGLKIKTDSLANVYVLGVLYEDTAYFGSYSIYGVEYGSINFLVKYDSLGNILWAKYAGGFVYNQMNRMSDDKSQNLYITWDDRYNHSYLYKFDAAGTQLWRKDLGLVSYTCYVGGLIYSDDNYVYISIAYTYSGTYCSNAYSQGMIVLKLDSDGNCIWPLYANAYGYPSELAVGNFQDIYGVGTFGLSGQFGSIAFNTNQPLNLFVARISDTFTNIPSEESTASDHSIFPNPTTGLLTIQTQTLNTQLKIYNPFGQLIHQQINKSPNHQINLSNQPKGIYFLELTANNKREVQKIIIQ